MVGFCPYTQQLYSQWQLFLNSFICGQRLLQQLFLKMCKGLLLYYLPHPQTSTQILYQQELVLFTVKIYSCVILQPPAPNVIHQHDQLDAKYSLFIMRSFFVVDSLQQ